jgi:hypothetical protein
MKTLKRCALIFVFGVASTQLTACVVEPVHPRPYVQPYYSSPGPNFGWREHPREGWGWYHPDRGWHRGWM